jgi:hypothetical protein
MKSQTAGSGGYEGAIPAMVAIVDICPTCHRSMSLHPRKYPFGPSESCPERIEGAFPFIPGGARGPRSRRSLARSLIPTPRGGSEMEELLPTDPGAPRQRRANLVSMTMDLAPASEEFL